MIDKYKCKGGHKSLAAILNSAFGRFKDVKVHVEITTFFKTGEVHKNSDYCDYYDIKELIDETEKSGFEFDSLYYNTETKFEFGFGKPCYGSGSIRFDINFSDRYYAKVFESIVSKN